MRIGIFGGTFDPVHFGHLVLAEQCREQCRLDEVWFIPAGAPPHKVDVAISEPEQRAEMLELAIAGHERFRIRRLELERTGPSYTVETLQEFHDESPDRELFLLLGADSVRDFPTWRQPRQILELAMVVAVNRGDLLPAELSATIRQLGESASERFLAVQMPAIDLSASDIRRRVHEGRSIRYLVPRAVEIYIAQHGLYRESG